MPPFFIALRFAYFHHMFFILSKVLLFLISPSFWILSFLLWSFITKKDKRKKRLRISALVLFIIFSNPFLHNVLVKSWEPPQTRLAPGTRYSVAILMGGISSTDVNKQMYFGPHADRFIQAAKLYHQGVINKILVTGGSPSILKEKKIPEAFLLREQLLLQGIPDSCILVEHKAWNSHENAVFSKQILDSLHLYPPYLLVTSAIHMPRASAVFKKANVPIIPYPAAYDEINRKFSLFDFIPSTDVLTSWNPFLKEVIGLMVYRLTGKA